MKKVKKKNNKIKVITDTQLIDFLESKEGCGLISDDFGHWAVSTSGVQNVPEKAPADIQTTFFVEKSEWKSCIREAILSFMVEHNVGTKDNPEK